MKSEFQSLVVIYIHILVCFSEIVILFCSSYLVCHKCYLYEYVNNKYLKYSSIIYEYLFSFSTINYFLTVQRNYSIVHMQSLGLIFCTESTSTILRELDLYRVGYCTNVLLHFSLSSWANQNYCKAKYTSILDDTSFSNIELNLLNSNKIARYSYWVQYIVQVHLLIL